MRIYLALAAIAVACVQAEAQGLGARCAAAADAQALRGKERVHFLAACKAGRVAPWPDGYEAWQAPSGSSVLCSGSLGNTFLGTCPLCFLLASAFDNGVRCTVR
jgi:hypothetical protein